METRPEKAYSTVLLDLLLGGQSEITQEPEEQGDWWTTFCLYTTP